MKIHKKLIKMNSAKISINNIKIVIIMKKFNSLYNKLIFQYLELPQDNDEYSPLASIPTILRLLKQHGKTIELTDKPNAIIVKDAYRKNDMWYDEMLEIKEDGSLQTPEGDIYKNVLIYLGY